MIYTIASNKNNLVSSHEGVSKGFRTESLKKYTLTTVNTR